MADALALDAPQGFEDVGSYQVRDELGEYVARDLLGPWEGPTEQFPPRARGPRDRYLVGMLGPKHNPVSTIAAASEIPDTEPGSDSDGEDSELRETFSVQNAGRIWASSMGLSSTVPSDVDAVSVTVEWGHYGKVTRTADDGTRRSVWVRQPVRHALEVRLDGEPTQRLLLDNPGPEEQPEEDAAAPAEPVVDADPGDVGVFLAVDVRNAVGAAGCRWVELALINAQAEPPTNSDAGWLFQPRIQVTALDAAAGVFLGTGAARPRVGLLFPGQGSPARLRCSCPRTTR